MSRNVVLVVAPDGASGGGMGRVKDYIVEAPREAWEGLEPRALITRDGGGRLHSLRLLAGALATIGRTHRQGQLALVHVNMGDRLSSLRKGLIALYCRARGVPVVIHLHAVELDKLPGAMLWFLRKAFGKANGVILLGDVYRRWLAERLGLHNLPADILWNGVPMAPVAARDHLAARSTALHIVFLGSLGRRKGTGELVAALGALATRTDWRATLAGPGDIDAYRAQAQALGIADRITFPGWQDQAQVRELLASADMMVLPSFEEGLPLAILEALALGTPVIATPVGAIPEVLTHDADIVLTPPGDAPKLAAAIARLADDASLRQSLCDKGLATFGRVFAMPAYTRSLLAIWRKYIV
jgi:glycosyltransferase involved in cell wall biosynthesis